MSRHLADLPKFVSITAAAVFVIGRPRKANDATARCAPGFRGRLYSIGFSLYIV